MLTGEPLAKPSIFINIGAVPDLLSIWSTNRPFTLLPNTTSTQLSLPLYPLRSRNRYIAFALTAIIPTFSSSNSTSHLSAWILQTLSSLPRSTALHPPILRLPLPECINPSLQSSTRLSSTTACSQTSPSASTIGASMHIALCCAVARSTSQECSPVTSK